METWNSEEEELPELGEVVEVRGIITTRASLMQKDPIVWQGIDNAPQAVELKLWRKIDDSTRNIQPAPADPTGNTEAK